MIDTNKMVHVKRQDIQEDLDMGLDNGFNGMNQLLEASYLIELELDTGKFKIVKSAEELKQFFNFD